MNEQRKQQHSNKHRSSGSIDSLAGKQAAAFQGLRVAIVHDWLVGGGAERVVLELHRMFPEAPIYTSYATKEWQEKLDDKVITSWMQKWPFPALRKVLQLPRVWWFSRLDFSGYDLVISSSGNGEAKHVRMPYQKRSWFGKWRLAQGVSEHRKGDVHASTLSAKRSSQHSDSRQNISGARASGAGQADMVRKPRHILYCHSPTHFYCRHYDQYMREPGFGIFNPVARLGLKILVSPLRRWDYKAAQRPDKIIANSTHIQKDIKKYYGRDSVVIHPPVDIERFANVEPQGKKHGFITVGRQVPYKRTDIIVQACTKLNLPLKVIGNGPEHDRLVALAGPSIEFLTNVSDADLPQYLANAEAFIFAAFEDFGVAPVEALAACTPVIAYKAGGALDYVIEGKNGLFFKEQNVSSLLGALEEYAELDSKILVKENFDSSDFQKNLTHLVQKTV